MKSVLRGFLDILPNPISRELYIASLSLQDTWQNWNIPIGRVSSSLPNSEGTGTVLLLGERPQYTSWIYKIFGETLEPTPLETRSLLQVLKGKEDIFTADLMLCPVNPWTAPLFSQRGWRVLPLFVNCHADLSKPISELITSKGAKDDLRVARRLGYQFQLVNSDEGLHEFFHHMLMPMIKVRHEERAFLSQWEDIERTYRHGILIAAYLESEWIGAILLALDGSDTVRIANIGWRNGNDQWLKKGIAAALYHQAFVWAKENRYRKVNLGSSNPFANDGPLNFKLKWGASLVAPELSVADGQVDGARSFIGAKFNLQSSAAQSFLSSSPVLECQGSKIRAISWNAKVPPLFRRQLDLGCEWVNLAELCGPKVVV